MYPLSPFRRRISSIAANGSSPGEYLVAMDQSVSPDWTTTVGADPGGSAAWPAEPARTPAAPADTRTTSTTTARPRRVSRTRVRCRTARPDSVITTPPPRTQVRSNVRTRLVYQRGATVSSDTTRHVVQMFEVVAGSGYGHWHAPGAGPGRRGTGPEGHGGKEGREGKAVA